MSPKTNRYNKLDYEILSFVKSSYSLLSFTFIPFKNLTWKIKELTLLIQCKKESGKKGHIIIQLCSQLHLLNCFSPFSWEPAQNFGETEYRYLTKKGITVAFIGYNSVGEQGGGRGRGQGGLVDCFVFRRWSLARKHLKQNRAIYRGMNNQCTNHSPSRTEHKYTGKVRERIYSLWMKKFRSWYKLSQT